jgi:aminoglycoside phosphotransferase (APT) family kinase protein
VESITKNRQPVETLRRMVARAYGPDLVPTGDVGWLSELDHGWFNVAYEMTLRDDSHVVLKIAPPPQVEVMTYVRKMMATELAAVQLIRERTEVPVPPVDFSDDSLELCDATYFFMPFIEAENLGVIGGELPEEELDAYHEALGAANRELNSIVGSAFGPLANPGHRTWRAAFTEMFEDVLRDGERRSVDVGWRYDVVRQAFEQHAALLDDVVEPRYVEWDLWDSNVMVRDGRIVSILDHERAFYGDPLIEAGFVAMHLPAFGSAKAFMRGYGQSGLTETEEVRRLLYTVYLMLIMVIETDYRGHTDTRQYDWARERLIEIMNLVGALG